jgi:deoxyadenosine/deoxycytidine kinase
LLSRYDDWYDEYDYSPKMKINGDQLDYVENKDDLQIVLKQIDTMLSERDLLPKI